MNEWMIGWMVERMTLLMGMTRNGPPAPLQIIAINLELQAQNSESHVISVMRISDMHCSCFTGLQKTCRNLLCRTILLIFVAIQDSDEMRWSKMLLQLRQEQTKIRTDMMPTWTARKTTPCSHRCIDVLHHPFHLQTTFSLLFLFLPSFFSSL